MAGRIPQGFLDELVARSDIVDVINARIALKKSGREYKACCPFHSEKSPSFWVSPEKQFYHCFGCGAHGTVIGFLMQYEKLEFTDAVADLAQRAGLDLPQEAQSPRATGSDDLHDAMARAAQFFEQNLADNAQARNYVQTRAIDAATCAKFALGYATASWDGLLNRFGSDDEARRRLLRLGLIIERDTRGGERSAGFYDRFRDRLMFPIRDSRGRVIGFGGRVIDQGEPKYLNSPETPLFHKGRELYGLYEARQARADFKRLMIVEGYMDVVRLHQAGITYAVATLGTATTSEHLNKIFRLTRELVFCFDGDRAGRQAAWRALECVLPLAQDGRELKFMFLPDGHDPDTLVAAEGANAFESRLKDALPLSEYLVQQLASEVDLTHVDGRAKLKAIAMPLFARMPEGIYRELLATRLAEHVGIPAATLKKAFVNGGSLAAQTRRLQPAAAQGSAAAAHGAPAAAYRTSAAARGARNSSGRGNLLRQAITLVLHYPSVARSVKDPKMLAGVERPGVLVLTELLASAKEMSEPSTGMLLERWRGRPEHGRLSELAATEPLVADAAAAAQELRTAMDKLSHEYGAGARVDVLLRKAGELGLNSDEKVELGTLLKQKNNSGQI